MLRRISALFSLACLSNSFVLLLLGTGCGTLQGGRVMDEFDFDPKTLSFAVVTADHPEGFILPVADSKPLVCFPPEQWIDFLKKGSHK